MIDQTAETQTDSSNAPAVPGELPQQIGPYRIIEMLGKGGMGMVLLGESELPKRKVAIKLMLAPQYDAEALSRFRQEMEVLARLEHPGIGRLYEVGTITLAGTEQPWYAMEYVPGLPLDEYVKRHKLDVKAIFQLVAKIAHALQFAHQKGVIHRDIKPANIIVDAQIQPKILDFGIARLNEPDASGVRTRFGQIIGTLAYMSPEQLSSSANADVRSDVYALGVVLYELLTGELPVKISTTSLLDAIKELAEGKRVSLSALRPNLRGEVELIVETASNRELSRRYDSAASFAGDLESYLSNRPLQARRPSFGYVFGKFVRRNPTLVAAIALALLALIAATVWSLIAAERARVAQQQAQLAKVQAEARAAEADAVVGFLSDALAGAAPESTMGREVKLVDVLNDASKQTLPAAQANVEVKIRQTLLETYVALGLFTEAEAELDRMTALCSSLEAHASCRLMPMQRARVLGMSGRHEMALPFAKQGLDVVRTEFGANSDEAIDTQLNYAEILNNLGDSKASLKEFQDALQLSETRTNLPPKLDLKMRTLLSDAFAEQGDLTSAEAVLKVALTRSEATLGSDYPTVLLARNSMISFMVDRRENVQAIKEYTALLEAATRVFGPEHRTTMTILGNLAASQFQNGDLDVAEANFNHRAEVFSRKFAGDWKSILNNAISRAAVQRNRKRLAQGLADIDKAILVAAQHDTLPAELANAYSWRGFFLWQLGRLDEAQAQMESLVTRFERAYGEDDVQLARYRLRLGQVLIDQQQIAKGKALVTLVLPKLIESYGPDHPAVVEANAALNK